MRKSQSYPGWVIRAWSLVIDWSLTLAHWLFSSLVHRQIGLHERRLPVAPLDSPNRVRRDRNPRRVAERAGVEAEGPVVPRADGAAVFDEPSGEVAAGVGAGVVDHADGALVEEHGQL